MPADSPLSFSSDTDSPPGAGTEKPISVTVLTGIAGASITLFVIGAIYPSGINWGFHYFGFLPLSIASALIVFLVLFLFPPVQLKIVSLLSAATERFSRLPVAARIGTGSVALASSSALFWLMSEKAYLLGDGNLVTRIIRTVAGRSEIPAVFSTEPFAGFLFWLCRGLLDTAGLLLTDEFPIQLFNIACGTGSMFIIWLLVKKLTEDPVDRMLLFGVIAGSGLSQFFFGYVEVYPPLYCAFLLFLYLIVRLMVRGGERSLFALSALYGLLFAFHFAMLFLLPVMGLIWYAEMKRRSMANVILGIAVSLVTAAALLWLSGFTLSGFIENMFARGRHLLPISPGDGYWTGYGFFSPWHAVDLVNLIVLVWPAGLVVAYVAISGGGIRTVLKESSGLLLLTAACCGLLFAVTVNPELGMSRDWDLIATYLAVFPVGGAVMLAALLKRKVISRRILVMIAGLSMIPAAGWITVNAGGESGARRCAALLDFRVMGRHAYFTGLEELAVYYRWNKDIKHSAECYEQFLSLDPYRVRIWESLAHLYELGGDEQKESEIYERAVRQGAVNEEIAVSLSSIYLRRGDPVHAAAVLAKCVEALPKSAEMNRSYGSFLLTTVHNYSAALAYLRRSIALDSSSADAWYNAGVCCYRLGDSTGMKTYFGKFLQFESYGADADRVRQLLASPGRNSR